jgi:histone-lysine N-methyltransferase SETD1
VNIYLTISLKFFGYGLNHVRKALENSPGIEAVVAPLNEGSPQYQFCYSQPSVESIVELQRKRAAVAAEKKLENLSGCARTEGMTAVARSGGSDRITRLLVKNAEDYGGNDLPGKKQDTEKVKADKSRMQAKYRELKSVPMEQRLAAKRSHIHGWGLFTKVDLPKDSMIVEYMGEIVRQGVADRREKQYEVSGEGSCYMFRLDKQRIVDATMIGCMARFMNHCCRPNAYAKVITVDTAFGVDKKIMVFSLCDIKAGEEITYDYKFPVEDGSLRCTCGAPNCIGRLN